MEEKEVLLTQEGYDNLEKELEYQKTLNMMRLKMLRLQMK